MTFRDHVSNIIDGVISNVLSGLIVVPLVVVAYHACNRYGRAAYDATSKAVTRFYVVATNTLKRAYTAAVENLARNGNAVRVGFQAFLVERKPKPQHFVMELETIKFKATGQPAAFVVGTVPPGTPAALVAANQPHIERRPIQVPQTVQECTEITEHVTAMAALNGIPARNIFTLSQSTT